MGIRKKYSGMLKWESYDRNREKHSFDDDNNPFPAPLRVANFSDRIQSILSLLLYRTWKGKRVRLKGHFLQKMYCLVDYCKESMESSD